MGEPTLTTQTNFQKAEKAIAALDAKFPLGDKRAKDIADADAVAKGCAGCDASDFVPLSDVIVQLVRLRDRLSATKKLARAAEQAVSGCTIGAFTARAIGAQAKKARLLRDGGGDKARKAVQALLAEEIAALGEGLVYWSTLAGQCRTQCEALNKIGVRLKRGEKALAKAVKGSSKTVTGYSLAKSNVASLAQMQHDVTEGYGALWVMETQARMKAKDLGSSLATATATLAKMKGRDAMDFLEGLVD